MGVIETVKDIGLLVQKLDNVDLVKRLVELQEQVYAVVVDNRDLKERVQICSHSSRREISWHSARTHTGDKTTAHSAHAAGTLTANSSVCTRGRGTILAVPNATPSRQTPTVLLQPQFVAQAGRATYAEAS